MLVDDHHHHHHQRQALGQSSSVPASATAAGSSGGGGGSSSGARTSGGGGGRNRFRIRTSTKGGGGGGGGGGSAGEHSASAAAARQRNLKQRFVSLLKKFKVTDPEDLVLEHEQDSLDQKLSGNNSLFKNYRSRSFTNVKLYRGLSQYRGLVRRARRPERLRSRGGHHQHRLNPQTLAQAILQLKQESGAAADKAQEWTKR